MVDHTSSLQYRALPSPFWRELPSSEWPDPKLLVLNEALSDALNVTPEFFTSESGLDVLTGMAALDKKPPLAMAYCGHQFGQWAGLLGDGRARLVGDVIGQDGLRYELHLKGSGQTPFSRRGDGLSTLGSALREYIVSEAMASLGVPTSRALSIVTTGQTVFRNAPEPGAILCRSARSHIRVGTFQFAATSGNESNIKDLAEFAISRLYPDAPENGVSRYAYFLEAVSGRQAELVAQWMGLGFIHGVMNTDNMCVSAETIDYGPCAFMDDFHPGKVFSSIDQYGRYAWNRQPEMAHWNLARLAESLLPLLGDDEDAQIKIAEKSIGVFSDVFKNAFHNIWKQKFGLSAQEVGMDAFLQTCFKVMTEGQVDFTRFFTALTRFAGGADEGVILDVFSETEIGVKWLSDWKERSGFNRGMDDPVLQDMKKSNPVIIPRNHRVEAAIHAATAGDYSVFFDILKVLQSPFEANPEYEKAPEAGEIVHQTFCGT